MVIAPIGYIIQAVPLLPGGVGVGEAAFAGLYKLSGHPGARGVTARQAMRVLEWLIGLICYDVYLRMRAEVREIQHEVEEDQGEVQETGNRRQETRNRRQMAVNREQTRESRRPRTDDKKIRTERRGCSGAELWSRDRKGAQT